MRERDYQTRLIRLLKKEFPNAIIIKNDPNYIQGIPDLLILQGDKWGALEVKASRNAPVRPNQQHYIRKMKNMSFAAFIYPENEEEVLHALQRAFRAPRPTRLPKSE